MKKIHGILFLTLMFLFSSCKKEIVDSPGITADEQDYKSKLETILQITPLNKMEVDAKKKSGNVHLDFKTYQEAYEYFRFLEVKDGFTGTATLKFSPESTIPLGRELPLMAYSGFGSDYIMYTGPVLSSATVQGTFGTASVSVHYIVHAQMKYNWQAGMHGQKVYISKQCTSLVTTPPDFVYSGVGTVIDEPALSMTLHQTYGILSGIRQGTATIAGVTVSFSLTCSGGFNIQMGGSNEPPAELMLGHTLFVTSS